MQRIWIYALNRKLSAGEKEQLQADMDAFVNRWAAHQKKLAASYEIPYDHFIVLKVNEEQVNASGCSIDDSVRFLKSIEQKYDLSLFDRMQLNYLKDGEVQTCRLLDIAGLYKQGELHEGTLVFDNTLTEGETWSQKWQVPFGDSGYVRFK